MAAAVVIATAVCSAAAPPVSAVAGPSIGRHGACTDASSWRLKVRSADEGTLRVRFVIAGGAAGEKWNLFMDHNGVGFFAGSRISGDDGLVVVRRRTNDLDGSDTIRATAHDTVTGETCSARVTL